MRNSPVPGGLPAYIFLLLGAVLLLIVRFLLQKERDND